MDSFSGGCGSRLAFLGSAFGTCCTGTRVDPRVARLGAGLLASVTGWMTVLGGGTVERLDNCEVFLNCFRWADVCWMVI